MKEPAVFGLGEMFRLFLAVIRGGKIRLVLTVDKHLIIRRIGRELHIEIKEYKITAS